MQLNQPSPDPAPGGSGHDLPSWAQIFGTVFAVLAAMVAAATLSGAVAAILTAVATAFACAALYLATNRRPWTLPKQGQLAGAFFCALVFAGMALAVAVTGNDDSAADPAAAEPGTTDTATDTATGTAPGEPRTPPATETEAPVADVVIKKTAYSMVPSSSPLTNDRDKVDLDTGCPGWGPTSIPVGRSRCGELADLILEPDYLHAPDEQPMLALLDAGQRATFATCRRTLAQGTATSGVIPRSELPVGSQLCVLTDKDNVAAVHVVRRGGGIVIDFEVWE